MTSDAHRADSRRGHSLSGSATDWSKRRLAANLSISELAAKAGLARSVVGFIDQGRMIPKPEEEAALNAVLPALEATA